MRGGRAACLRPTLKPASAASQMRWRMAFVAGETAQGDERCIASPLPLQTWIDQVAASVSEITFPPASDRKREEIKPTLSSPALQAVTEGSQKRVATIQIIMLQQRQPPAYSFISLFHFVTTHHPAGSQTYLSHPSRAAPRHVPGWLSLLNHPHPLLNTPKSTVPSHTPGASRSRSPPTQHASP